MLDEVLEILKSDSVLSEFLHSSMNDKKIYSYRGKAETCIAYKLTPISSDGIKAQNKLEINCISTDYEKAAMMLGRVKALLITVGDKTLNNNILNVALNGGGSLFDEKTEQHILKAFFILTTKERML